MYLSFQKPQNLILNTARGTVLVYVHLVLEDAKEPAKVVKVVVKMDVRRLVKMGVRRLVVEDVAKAVKDVVLICVQMTV